ncbi:MAG: hypothetical protein M3R24_04345 [Chloroflexota bacterium]|nr:hypothetical protein [Chloroflexota bacterium]
MPGKAYPTMTFRSSSALQTLLKHISTNESAALRALTLIGADAVGLDLSTVLPDLRQTMSADLPLEIHKALQQIYYRVAEEASPSLKVREADHVSSRPAVPLVAEKQDPHGGSATAAAPIPDDPAPKSQIPDDDPLADLGIEYG